MITKNICVGEKFTDKQTNEEKTKWTTIGTAFVNDDGRINIKIDVIPINWNGFASLFDKKE